MTSKTRRSAPIAVAVAFLSTGCGAGDRLPVYPVRGEVKVGGEPAAGARVFFHPAERAGDPRGLHPFAVVEPDGSFRITTYLAKDGAPAGEYVVTITWPTKAGPDDEPSGDRLKGAYADPKKSPLRAAVSPGDNVLAPFLLK